MWKYYFINFILKRQFLTLTRFSLFFLALVMISWKLFIPPNVNTAPAGGATWKQNKNINLWIRSIPAVLTKIDLSSNTKNLIELLSPKLHQKRDPSLVPLWSAPKKRFHCGLHLPVTTQRKTLHFILNATLPSQNTTSKWMLIAT